MTSAAMSRDKVLVLCSTGKVGRNVCLALAQAGFDVFGTTRSDSKYLPSIGVTPVIADYTQRAGLDHAFAQSQAKKVFVLTDYFRAARKSVAMEVAQGKSAIDAAKEAGVDHVIFMSVADAECFDDKTHHIKAKVILENEVKQSGLNFTILRPSAFFENLDDAANWNPLKKGKVTFLSDKQLKFCSTYDIGRAAALIFANPQGWRGKTLDIVSWKGDLSDIASALERVSGTRVRPQLAMPIFLRRLFLNDLHHMCLYFEERGLSAEPDEFKKVIPDAFSAEDWFRFHNRYANGEPIVAQ
jgi:taspase (threonine aspartase 1)